LYKRTKTFVQKGFIFANGTQKHALIQWSDWARKEMEGPGCVTCPARWDVGFVNTKNV